MDAQTVINRSFAAFKNYHLFMNLYAYLCDDKGYLQKKRLYPLLEKHLFSILISDRLYQDLNCLSFFVHLYHFQIHELDMQQAKPFAPRSRMLRDQLIAALERELSIEIDDLDKQYQFKSHRLALEIALLNHYYPQSYIDDLPWVKLYHAAQYESQAYVSVRAIALIEQAYANFDCYEHETHGMHPMQACREKQVALCV